MYVCFARHAESEANILGVIENEGDHYGLTPLGKGQALALAESLRSEHIGRVYCSPIRRAVETAEIVCGALGLGFEERAELKEFSVGNLEGCSTGSAWREFHRVETKWMAEGDAKARVAGGECLDDVRLRFGHLIEEIVREYSETDERLLLIGHGGTLACSLPAILENVDNRFSLHHPIKPAGLIVARWVGPKFLCLRWTDSILVPEKMLA